MSIQLGRWPDRFTLLNNMAEGLRARATGRAPTEAGRPYYDCSFAHLAHASLVPTGEDRHLSPTRNRCELIDLALHTTSDFTNILGNTLNQITLAAYSAAAPTFKKIATRVIFKDFRPHTFLRSGDFPVPLQVGEHAEFKYGTTTDGKEIVALATFGRIFGLTRQALINDDAQALGDLGRAAGLRAAEFENTTFFNLCIAPNAGLGPVLSDGLTVFHATHSNVASAGALDLTRLSSARALLQKQTTADGQKLNATAAVLLVAPDYLTFAETLVAQLALAQPDAARIVPMADANISGTRFYVLASPSRLPNYVWGRLGSGDGPMIVTRSDGGFIDGVEIRLSLDFGAGAADFRGGATGAGV